MPLLSPSQIHAVLKAESAPARSATAKSQLAHLLENANLTPEEVLENISSLMRSAESDAVRGQMAKLGLELNGMLAADKTGPDFSVTINIIDSEFTSLNPILIPR